MDELERLRRMLDDAPSPGPGRKAEARRELLELAEGDSAEDTPGSVTRLDRARGTLRRRPTKVLAAAAAVVLVAGAAVGLLGGDDATDRLAQPGTSPTPARTRPAPMPEAQDPTPALAASCTGPEGRYEIRYPEGWHTNADGCELFDAEPLDLEGAIGGRGLAAISVGIEPAPFDALVDPGDSARLSSSEERTVAGRPAVRQLRVSTGTGAAPEGTRTYVYFLDLGDQTLVGSTRDTGEPDFEERRRLLDRMMASLEIHGS